MARLRHRPIEVVFDGRRECSACGLTVVGFGATVRHEGEPTPAVTPDPEDARSVSRARDIALSVARRLRGATDAQLAEAVADALYTEGLIRRRPSGRRGNVLLDDPEPRDPDHAERAAGERVPA
jgi:hypothetical protein